MTDIRRIALLQDGTLELRVAESLVSVVAAWLPFSAVPVADVIPEATITVKQGIVRESPVCSHSLRLGDVSVWVDDAHRQAILHGPSSGAAGHIDLAVRGATLTISPDANSRSIASDISTMLTLSAALLFNRLGKALVHAAAVAPPLGPAWLLVGDTHAGKTTTTVNLMAAGWEYLSDDHVVLSTESDECATAITVDGWPRTFHLDEGWSKGLPGGLRVDADPRALAPGQLRAHARLAGLLFLTVVRDAPTRIESLSAADALALLLRQSPWLVADRHAAPAVLAMLTHTAKLPARHLFLGLDTFSDSGQLVRCLAPLLI